MSAELKLWRCCHAIGWLDKICKWSTECGSCGWSADVCAARVESDRKRRAVSASYSPIAKESPFPSNSSCNTATNFSRIFSFWEKWRSLKMQRLAIAWGAANALGGLSYLIQLIELKPLFLRAAASNRTNIQHPVTEFNKRPPAEERKNHQDCKLDQNTHVSGWWWLWGTFSWAAWCWPCSSDRSWWQTEAVLLPYDSEWTEKADKLNLQPSMSFQDTRKP